MLYNDEGYIDTTPYLAYKNMAKSNNSNFRPIVYICSPYAGDVVANAEAARKYCRFAVDSGVIPVAMHLFLPQFMDEATERELAMFINLVMVTKCMELWVFGDTITDGMGEEIEYAKKRKMTIRYFTKECEVL